MTNDNCVTYSNIFLCSCFLLLTHKVTSSSNSTKLLASMETMEKYFILAALVITLTSIFLLALSRSQRDTLLSYLYVKNRGRRSSSSTTPPRSVSPEKKVPSNVPPTGEYKDAFPPSSRDALARTAQGFSAARQKKLQGSPVDQVEFRKSLIPFTADFRDCGPSTYTPMEISMDEIRALGDFPDYAELSGVPLPRPYEEFVIEKALPRPYRPFRWAYHQTMCKFANYYYLR